MIQSNDKGKEEQEEFVANEENEQEKKKKKKKLDDDDDDGEAIISMRSLATLAFGVAKAELIGSLVALLISSGQNLSVPKLLGRVLDMAVDKKHSRETIVKNALISVGIFAIGASASIARVYLLQNAAWKIAKKLQSETFRAVMESGTQFDRDAIVQCLNKDAQDVANSFCKNAAGLYRGINSGIGGSLMVLFISPKLALMSVGILPVLGVVAMTNSKKSRKLAKELKSNIEEAISHAGDRVENVETVKMFGNEQHEIKRFNENLEQVNVRNAAVAEGIFMGGLGFSLNCSLLGLVVYGGSLVSSGDLTAGEMTSFVAYSGLLGLGFSQISSSLSDFQKVSSSASKIKMILHQKSSSSTKLLDNNDSKRDDDDNNKDVDKIKKTTIRIENLSFRYRSGLENVIDNLSLELKPGKLYALAGLSGQGKTTLCKLLCRLLERDKDTSSGSITWNGKEIKSMDVGSFRKRLGVCMQAPKLFKDISIRENIRYGKLDASDSEVDKIASSVEVDSLLDVLGDVSVGELQRVACCRALLRSDSAEFFIIDEGASSQDTKREQLFLDVLRDLVSKKDKIVLVVCHRISMLRNADEILVLQGGQIVEQGSFSELLSDKEGALSTCLAHDRSRQSPML